MAPKACLLPGDWSTFELLSVPVGDAWIVPNVTQELLGSHLCSHQLQLLINPYMLPDERKASLPVGFTLGLRVLG